MGWVQNLRFSYIFMEPAKTHGIYIVLTSSASETVVFAAFCNTTLYTTTLIVLLLQKQQQLLLLLPLLRTTTYYYVLRRTTTYYYVLRIRTTTYFVYVLLRTTYTYICSIFVCIHNKNDIPTLRAHVHTYIQTNHKSIQTKVLIHKSIQTYSYTYTWLQMVRPPPTHPQGGGGNIMCICSIFVCIHNKNDMPTLLGHVHTYIQTNHKSIQTNSYHT